MERIIYCIDEYLEKMGLESLDPVTANKILEDEGILNDNQVRPGKPIRDLLRKGRLPHAYQVRGKGSTWVIPHSKRIYIQQQDKKLANQNDIKSQMKSAEIAIYGENDCKQILESLETARKNYQPEKVKYLLIAEAPPDNVERFFYYESVSKHDYLFLGVIGVLYPEIKNEYLANKRDKGIKRKALVKLKDDGFYLLDLFEMPLSCSGGNYTNQVESLTKRIDEVIEEDTVIILIKVTVYDAVFSALIERYENVVNERIPFPAQGGQKVFHQKFSNALGLKNIMVSG